MHLHWVHVLKRKAFKRQHVGQFTFFLVSWSLFRLKSWWAWGTKLIFSACFTLLSLIVFIKLNCVCVCSRVRVRMWSTALCGGQRTVCGSCYHVWSPGMELGASVFTVLPIEPSCQSSACVTLYSLLSKNVCLFSSIWTCFYASGAFLEASPWSGWNSNTFLVELCINVTAGGWLWGGLFALT